MLGVSHSHHDRGDRPQRGIIGSVRLQFGEHDEDAYWATKEELLAEIEDSIRADGAGSNDIDETVSSISVLLDWRWNYSTGQLDDWHLDDVDEFLLDWAPGKYAAPPEAGADLCMGVADFFVHMATRDRLTGGPDRAAALIGRAMKLTPAVVEAMADPSRFGVGKSVLSTPLTGADGDPLVDLAGLLARGDLDDDQLQALLEERMDAFNALPMEQRTAITDGAMARRPPQRVSIPVVVIAPSTEELEQSIAASRLIKMVDALIDHIGPKGIAVTSAGNLRLADAKLLVDLLGTDDEFAPQRPWNEHPEPVRTSTDLHQLTLVFDAAEGAGAFDRLKTKVKVDPGWFERATIERAKEIIDSVIDLRPVSDAAHWQPLYEISALIEDGIPHWLSMALPEGAEIQVEPIAEQAIDVVSSEYRHSGPLFSGPEFIARYTTSQVSAVFALLEFAGIVEWHDSIETADDHGYPVRRGGWFRLTPLGRYTMVDHIRLAGYDFPTLDDLTEATAEEVVNVLLTSTTEADDLLGRWRRDESIQDRAAALAEFAMEAESPEQRLLTMELLAALEPVDEVAPVVRQMLDSPMSGHAAMFLLSNELATSDEMGDFLDIGPMVDLFSTLLDAPDTLAEMFLTSHANVDGDLLEELWRHDQPETIEILEILGAHLSDRNLAKAARKAALKHRSWMANRHR
jgi:hypothetical protein